MPGLIPRPATFAGIKRWQLETTLPRGAIKSVAFSPDGLLLACGTETGQVRIYDAESLNLVKLLVGHTDRVLTVAWSPDGHWLASSGFGAAVRLWNVKEQSTSIITVEDSIVHTISWAPDSSQFAVANTNSMSVYTTAGDRTFSTAAVRENVVAWSPNGNWIASDSFKGQLRFWRVNDFQCVATVKTQGQVIHSVAWSPDSLRVAIDQPDQIQVHKIDGTLDKTVDVQANNAHFLAWHPLKDILVYSGVSETRLHDLTDDSTLLVFPDTGNAFGVAWHPNGRHFVCVSERRSIRVFGLDGTMLNQATGHAGEASHVKWSHDGQFLASTEYGIRRVRLWDINGVSLNAVEASHIDSCIAWHPSRNHLATQKRGGGLQVWDHQGKLIAQGSTPIEGYSSSIAWNPDGEHLTAGRRDTGVVEIWEPGGRQLATFKEGHVARIMSVVWSPDGKTLATAADDGHARFWNSDGSPGAIMKHGGGHACVAWDSTSDRIAVSRDHTIIWNLDGTPEAELKGYRRSDHSIDWSPNGESLVTGSGDRTVRQWTANGSPQNVLHEHDGEVLSVDWSPTRELIASGSRDATVIVWDAETTEPLWVGVQLGTGDSATFSAAGQVLDGDPDVIEEHFVYLVENEDGQQELLKPSEFQQRIGSRTATPDSDPDRNAAQWVLANHGWVQIHLDDTVSPQMVKAGQSLPKERFALIMANLDGQATAVTNEDMKRFAGLERLNWLNLNNIPVADEGIRYLSTSVSLRHLNLSGTSITNQSLQYLKQMPRLKGLVLNVSGLTESAIDILESFPVLDGVALNTNVLTSIGLPKLGRLQKLVELHVVDSEFSDTDLQHLESLSRLRFLQLHQTAVTAAGATALSRTLPQCEISYGTVSSQKTVGPVDPDRSVAQWVLENRGWVQVRSMRRAPRRRWSSRVSRFRMSNSLYAWLIWMSLQRLSRIMI